MQRCQLHRGRLRHRITLALDAELWERFQPVLKEHREGSFTSWLEYAMECYSRNSCDGCPYAEEEDQEKVAICKILDKIG
jgi:hypothetical protein